MPPTGQDSTLPSDSRKNRVFPQQRAGFFAGVLFLLLFSGPPKFRLRDPTASLSGELDFSIIVNIIVWLMGGLWVVCQLYRMHRGTRPRLRLRFPQKMAALVILLLGASTFVSIAPAVTAFKAYQILVAFLFSLIFAEWYGIETCLNRLFLGSALLCLAMALSVVVAPDLVLFPTETGALRLRGLGITEAAFAATLAIVLLMTTRRKLSAPVFFFLGACFCAILLFSFGRIAWLAVGIVFAVAAVKRPNIKALPWVYAFWGLAAVALAAGLFSGLSEYRDPDTVYTLTGRVGLWAFLISSTVTGSPWLGFGYLAGTRNLGMEYDPELGSGHSIFLDVFVGGGLLSLIVFVVLVVVLTVRTVKLLRNRNDAVSFAVGSLFLVFLLFAFVGEDIDSSPFGFTFWALVTMLSLIRIRPPEKLDPAFRGDSLVVTSTG